MQGSEERLRCFFREFEQRIRVQEDRMQAILRSYQENKERQKIARALALQERPVESKCRTCFLLDRSCICGRTVSLPSKHKVRTYCGCLHLQ
jgi:hypothetical protein